MSLDEIREQKKADALRRLANEQEEQAQAQQQLQQIESQVKARLTKDALSRYGNIRTAHPELAVQVILVMAQLLEKQPDRMIDDAELKKLLQFIQLQKKTKEPTIRFR